MKTITLFFALILGGLTSYTFGQRSKLWAQINDLSAIPVMNADGVLSSSNAAFNASISSHSITSVTQALPASKQEKLQRVFEIECECTEEVLLNALTSIPFITGIELCVRFNQCARSLGPYSR